jgi:aminoglycoside phosphotransferase (APT) family kinase protein
MHDDEVAIDGGLVRHLVDSQHPRWRDLPLRFVPSTGTVHALWRLGDDLVVRLPRVARWQSLDKELRWLPWFAERLPVAVPEPVAAGEPDERFPHRWAVFRWLEGVVYEPGDRPADAERLASVLQVLQGLPTDGAPLAGPGQAGRSAAHRDGPVRAAIEASAHLVDAPALRRAWEAGMALPRWRGERVWLHADLLPGNVLTLGGRLHALIDWGSAAVGDPATDLMAAWALFRGESRRVFRRATGVDDETWERGRFWALTRIMNVAYYETSNPAFSLDARATLAEALTNDTTSSKGGS